MTRNTPPPVSFGKFFGFFQRYWNYSQRRGELSEVVLFAMTSQVFLELKKLWIQNKWNLEELEEICGEIYHHNKAFDPSYFLNEPFAYVNHIKIVFILTITYFK